MTWLHDHLATVAVVAVAAMAEIAMLIHRFGGT